MTEIGDKNLPAVGFFDEDGTPYGIKNIGGKPRISSMPYLYDIAEGNIADHEIGYRLGFTPAMTTAESDVWSYGGKYTFPAVAGTLSMVSSSAADASAGYGARTVKVEYLDENYARQFETVTLNGVTPVTMTGSAIRVNGMNVLTAGSAAQASGSISLFKNAAGSVVHGYITPGYTAARSSVYTVPAGFNLYITTVDMSFGYAANQTHYARLYLRIKQLNKVLSTLFYPFVEAVVANSVATIALPVPIKVVEKVDFKVSGIASATGTASAVLRGWMENS